MNRVFNQLDLEAGRDETLTFELYDLKDRPIALIAGDKLYWTIAATRGGAPLKEIDNVTPLSGGSLIVISQLGNLSSPNPALRPCKGEIRIKAADTTGLGGLTYAAFDLDDAADPGAGRKPISRGVIYFGLNP